MGTLSRYALATWISIAALLAGCTGGAAPAPTATVSIAPPPTAGANPTSAPEGSPIATIETGELQGTVAFDAPPTPAVEIYILNTESEQYYIYDVAESAGTAEFHATVQPGTYRVFGWTADGGQYAAFMDPTLSYAALGTVTVAAGQTVGGVDLRAPASGPCSSLALPAAPDGKYPAVEATCGLISGVVTFDSPPTPALVVYALSADDPVNGFFASTQTAEAEGEAPFALAVLPGNYNLFAWTLDGKRYAAFMTETEEKLDTVLATAGQTTAGLQLRAPGPHPDRVPCEGVALPATPDGKFEAEGCGTIAGIVALQGPSTPPMFVYVVDAARPDRGYWAWMQTSQMDGEAPFEINIRPGKYVVFAYTADGSQYAAHTTDGVALTAIQVEAAKRVEGIQVRSPSSGPCTDIALPATPDGRFPAKAKPC